MIKNKGLFQPHPYLHSILAVITAFLLIAAFLAQPILDANATVVDTFLTSVHSSATEEQKAQTNARAEQLALQAESEGVVLLHNPENVLPLSDTVRKVNVFGWAATQWLGGGSGSGGVTAIDTDFLTALEQNGIAYNPQLIEMYRSFQSEREFTFTLRSFPEESCRLYEPDIQDTRYYTDELLEQAKAFSDTAILVIGRPAGESNDCTQVQYKRTKSDGPIVVDENRTYLDFSTEEEALLAYLGQTYQQVIVILNTANTMALGPIETTPGIDACLLAGYTGQSAVAALPDILWGNTSPSGRTTDTFAYDFASAASYANSGQNGVGAYTNAEGMYPMGAICTNLSIPQLYQQVSYVDYAESIYTGYQWYETADAEGFWDRVQTPYGDGYSGVVQYPFGYGLSYTDFAWEVLDAPADGQPISPEQDLTFRVKVTNTGSYPGKEVVQLYGTPPYYPGGIEKSAVKLVDFAKTQTLAPGESEVLTLASRLSDLASYDALDANSNDFSGYELDTGFYEFSLRDDAHTAASIFHYSLTEAVQYPNDPITGRAVTNKFTGTSAMDGMSLDGSDTEQNIRWLRRADFVGTFPAQNIPTRPMHTKLRETNRYTRAMAQSWAQQSIETPPTYPAGDYTIEKNGILTALGWSLGEDYDHPQWEPLLHQIPQKEMELLVFHGYSQTAPLPSIGKPLTNDGDGPSQIGSYSPQRGYGTGFPCASTLAQSWNTDLAQQIGRTIGQQAAQLGYSGWYAPAANLHRTPFGGRNYEYYSEDSLLSGRMCGSTVSGSMEAGTYCFVKHLICNDQESHIYRDGIYTWMTEQTLRELYLEPFRILVEEYGGTGLMTAYNRIGGVWSGGSTALLTGILRDEWNFHGTVITDYSDHRSYMNGDQALRAGGDLWMDGTPAGFVRCEQKSPAYLAALRRATKNILYQYLHVRVVNRDYVADSGDTAMLYPTLHRSSSLFLPAIACMVLILLCIFVQQLCAAVLDCRIVKANQNKCQ